MNMFVIACGLAAYGAVSMRIRYLQAKNKLEQLKDKVSDCKDVAVVFKSHMLCPRLKTYVIGFDDKYESKYPEIYDPITNTTTIDNNVKIEKDRNKLIKEVLEGKSVDRARIINMSTTTVAPALFPGGYSVYTFTYYGDTNKFVWVGSERVWGHNADIKFSNSFS